MSDWGWITFGYLVVYGAIAGYAVLLAARIRRARGRLNGQR
jgi:voltage-gated potassium channel Kch